MRTKTNIGTLLLVLTCTITFGQLQDYDQKIALSDITDQWHTVPLPNTLFSHVSNSLADIRIYGVTETDTLETPYVLKTTYAKGALAKVDFKLINTASNPNGYYYSYEVSTAKSINEIQLDVKNENFDWKVTLEASQNQQEWFTLLEDYRILSIKNGQTDYTFTNLNFPNAKYRYYRLLVQSDVKPQILATKIYLDSITPATYQDYDLTNFKVTEADKTTLISMALESRLPVSYLKLKVMDEIDYYRPIEIQYISDSVRTEKGWRYSYQTLTTGTLSSLEKNEFKFSSSLAKKLRIKVYNYDNQPLSFSEPVLKGYVHELVARFDKPSNYYLAYGKSDARTPIYDIVRSGFSLPDHISAVTLGEPEKILRNNAPGISPIFENKWWLWGIMGIVILVLGVFTLNMMRQKN